MPELLLLGALCGAIGRRIDGGLLQTWGLGNVGKIVTRLLLAVALVLPMTLAGLPLRDALVLLAAVWIGASTGMWSGLAMGRVGDMTAAPVGLRAWAIAAGFMTLHGLGNVALPVAWLWWAGWSPWPLLAAGLLCAPVYELAFRWPWHVPALNCTRYDPPPTAELIWGALRGIAGVATILMGVH